MTNYTPEKIKLMQDKKLLHKLYLLTYSGSMQMNQAECSQLADMILRVEKERKDEK